MKISLQGIFNRTCLEGSYKVLHRLNSCHDTESIFYTVNRLDKFPNFCIISNYKHLKCRNRNFGKNVQCSFFLKLKWQLQWRILKVNGQSFVRIISKTFQVHVCMTAEVPNYFHLTYILFPFLFPPSPSQNHGERVNSTYTFRVPSRTSLADRIRFFLAASVRPSMLILCDAVSILCPDTDNSSHAPGIWCFKTWNTISSTENTWNCYLQYVRQHSPARPWQPDLIGGAVDFKFTRWGLVTWNSRK